MTGEHTPDERPTVEVVYDFDPRNLPPEMLRAVGLAVAASSQTESIVQEMIGALLGIDNLETRALTAHMSAPLKDHICRVVAELNAPSVREIDTLDDLLDAVNEAFTKRNQIVHNALMRHPETGEIYSFRERARGSLSIALQPITVEQIEKDALTIYEAGMALMGFMMSRGIGPHLRTKARNLPVDRRPKVRAARRTADG